MKRKLLTSTAVLALIAAPMAPAFAQDDTTPAAEEPAIVVPGDDGGDMMQTETGAAPAGEAEAGAVETGTARADDGIFFIYEEDNQYRSTDLVGHTVTNGQDETLGDINDLIVSADGQLEGVIIGVGGFLGIGEKNVGVRFDALNISEDPETRDMTLALETTRESLEGAPAFVSKEAQQAAADREKAMDELGVTDTGTTSAIEPGAAAPAATTE